MLLSVFLERRAFIVFGALGVFGYVGHLAYRVFQGSLLFPFVLTIIGVGVIFLGIQYRRRRRAIERAILGGLFPDGARRLLPPSAAGEEGSVILKATDRSTYLDLEEDGLGAERVPGRVEQGALRGPLRPADDPHALRAGGEAAAAPARRARADLHPGGLARRRRRRVHRGEFVWRRPGSVHRAWSPDGCLGIGISERPNEFLEEPDRA